MLFSNILLATTLAADNSEAIENAAAAEPSVGSLIVNTTITGIVVVFVVLLLLVFVIGLYSKLVVAFTDTGKRMSKKKAKKEKVAEEKKAVVTEPVIAAAPAQASNEISGDIIAVIAAAVASMDPGFTVKSVKRVAAPASARAGMRPAWGNAGVRENTRPF